MTLQSSGLIKLSQVGAEKGVAAPWSLVQMSTTNINQNSPSKPDGVAPHKLSEFYGYDQNAVPPQKLDAPTISPTWDFANHEMRVAITPGANNPSTGMTWTVLAVPDTSATGGTTSTLTYIDDVGAEDGSQSCYTCIGNHADWQSSDESPQACAARGNVT